MAEISELEARLIAVEVRNHRVELDKAWETSWCRRLCISVLTYCVVVVVFFSIGISQAYLNACIPVIGYLLSTLSLPKLKAWWISYFV